MELIVGSIDYSADSSHLGRISRVFDFYLFIYFPMKYLLLDLGVPSLVG